MKNDLLIGFLNTKSLSKLIKGEKDFNLYHLISDKDFDHIGLIGTGRRCISIPDNDRNTQRFCGHFTSQKLESTTI